MNQLTGLSIILKPSGAFHERLYYFEMQYDWFFLNFLDGNYEEKKYVSKTFDNLLLDQPLSILPSVDALL